VIAVKLVCIYLFSSRGSRSVDGSSISVGEREPSKSGGVGEGESAQSTEVNRQSVFNMMRLLAPVVIQDVAVWKLKHPERCKKSPLMADPLWRTEEFKVCSRVCFVFNRLHSPILLCFPGVYVQMEKALQDGEENSPMKATVDSVLQGVDTQFTNLHHEIKRMQDGLQELKGMTR
jgi:hypothetical protein